MDLRGRRVTVMGLGRFGGGAGVTRWLAAQGAAVLVTDLAGADDLDQAVRDIADLLEAGSVTLRLGGHDEADFRAWSAKRSRGADLVVANPAVPRPWENPMLAAASAAGVPLTTEIRLLIERLNRRRVIGVTGTAGKSTTTAMIHHVLAACGVASRRGGNIGGSLLSEVHAIGADEWVVLELSSAMLHWLRGWSPGIAVLTNVEPNHLDWHGSFEHYARCKGQIFSDQLPGEAQLRGDEVPAVALPPLAVPGEHNRCNAHLAVAAACSAVPGLDRAAAAAALADFRGLPHRLEFVAESRGRRFFNDSKSTTPSATRLAVEALGDPRRVHLIVGGYDKQIDLEPLVVQTRRVAGVYAIGQTGPRLAGAAGAVDCGTLDVAVERALSRMKRGDVLLLSPGCASWDQFENYERRGEAFCALVKEKVSG